jgi:hypothetical protein
MSFLMLRGLNQVNYSWNAPVAIEGSDTNQIKSNQGSKKMADSLYSRLGGYDGIAMFATTLVSQAQKDGLLERFWANRGEDRIARECQLLIDYLVKETGG